MRSLVVTLGLTAIAACSEFTTDGGSADGGADAASDSGVPVVDGGGADAVVHATDAGADADAGGRTKPCTSFAAEPFGDGWQRIVSGGTFALTTFMGRSGLEARVVAGGQRAVVARTLIMPPDGTFKVTIPLVVTGAPNGNTGWLVDIVSIACTNPVSSVSLELGPDGALFVEAMPAAPASGVASLGLPPQVWSDLVLAVADTTIAVTLGGQTRTVVLDSTTPFRTAVGCALTVGAAAKSNVSVTTVHAEKVCLQHL